MKRLYSENDKTMKKETEQNTKNGRMYLDHGLEELVLLKCLYYIKVIYRFNAIPIRIPMEFLALEKLTLNLDGTTIAPK